MKRTFTLFLFVLLMLALAACGTGGAEPTAAPADTGATNEVAPPAADTPAPAEEGASGEEKTAVIGFTASQTGSLNVESTKQINGFNQWMNEVNEAGGITLADGTTVKFTSVFYDDESNTDRVQELYTRLATEDAADFLISPYSSGLTDAAAVIAEQNGKIMITTGAASDSTYQKGFTLVFQAYTPASRYMTGALDLLAATDPNVSKIAIVHENDKFSTDVSTALNDYALEKGYEVVLFEGYDSGTSDFAPFINRIQDAAPEAILGGGHFEDGSTLARQLNEEGIDIGFVALLVAPAIPDFAELGEAAVGIVGPSQWEPNVAFSAETAGAMAFYGPSSQEFLEAYRAAYDEEPSYHSAGGYVAGLLLQKAIEDAGSLETDAVKAALDALDIGTFFGSIKFDTSAENHGLQIGHSMVYIQWQDEGGTPTRQIVWPTDGATAEIVYPKP
jgi:branched-chain amino acid transport system substrate-binding protein